MIIEGLKTQQISLKKLDETIEGEDIIGFLDESSPQTTANTQKMLSFNKPEIYKNTSKLKANTFGFYALNGASVVDFMENSKKRGYVNF